MGAGAMRERRKIERYELHVPTTIEIADATGCLETLQVETKDISASGAYFVAPREPICEGAQLRLEMILPVERLKDLIGANKKVGLRLEGRVIRKDANGIAVLFDKKYQITALNHHHAG